MRGPTLVARCPRRRPRADRRRRRRAAIAGGRVGDRAARGGRRCSAGWRVEVEADVVGPGDRPRRARRRACGRRSPQIFTCDSSRSRQQLAQRRAGIRRRHEGLADQERRDAAGASHARQVGRRVWMPLSRDQRGARRRRLRRGARWSRGDVWNVRRSRLLTPTSRAPRGERGRSARPASWASTSASSPSCARAMQLGAARRRAEQAAISEHGVGAERPRFARPGTASTRKSLRRSGSAHGGARPRRDARARRWKSCSARSARRAPSAPPAA